MKYTNLRLVCCTVIAGSLFAGSAGAANIGIENTLKQNANLSHFYESMVQSGVAAELDPTADYTVFAPENSAFAGIDRSVYPCFYSGLCKAEMATLIRNHIVPGRIAVGDLAGHKGGIFSLGQRFIPVGASGKNRIAVSGRSVMGEQHTDAGTIYTLDGVIASAPELSVFQQNDEEHSSTTQNVRTISDPGCEPKGCPDASSVTTTTIRTITNVAIPAK